MCLNVQKKNDTLIKLYLCYNKIDNIEVLKCLENNSSLTEIDLSENKITEKDISVFNKVLEKNYLLIYLIY